jgi:CRP-like cAMP-binding protein
MSEPQNPGDGIGNAKPLLDFVRQSNDVVFVPRGSVLFQEGDPCHGAYFVDEGEIELSITSGERRVSLGHARSGHILALSSVLAECDYQCSAQAAKDSKLVFLAAEAIRFYLRQNPETCLTTVQLLGSDLLDISTNTIRPLRLQPRHPRP